MMVTDFNTQAIELLGADTPGVIADALQEAYERGRVDMRNLCSESMEEVSRRVKELWGQSNNEYIELAVNTLRSGASCLQELP